MIVLKIKKFFFLYKEKIVALIFALAGVFLAISFYTFDPYDSSWFYYNSESGTIRNSLGAAGANVAGFFFYLFGVSSFLLIPLLFYVSYLFLRNISLRAEWERLLALFLLPFVSAAICVLRVRW